MGGTARGAAAPRHARTDQALTSAVAALLSAGHGSTTLVDLRLSQSDPPTWLHLSLLVPGQALGAFGERPQILATLFDPRRISTLDPFALANMFRLTPTEAKVATQIAEGLPAEDIAKSNGTRIGTVRTQINAILQKFGTTRQAEVVRILRQGEALWARADKG
jgi:DNA-binding CsgD family transcriptional regulator